MPSCAYARKSDATRSWCTQLAAPAPPDVARRLSGGPPQVTAKSMISPCFLWPEYAKIQIRLGYPKRGCQGLNMTSIWGLAFEFGCRCEPWELQVSSGKFQNESAYHCLPSTRCLPNQLSLSNSIYIFGDKITKLSLVESQCLFWTNFVKHHRSPVPRLDTPCPPPAQSNSSSRAALTWQMMAVSHRILVASRLKQPVVRYDREFWSFSCRLQGW